MPLSPPRSPDPQRLAFPPPEDAPILPWYDGAFAQGFIALHPFFSIEGLDPASCTHGTVAIERHDLGSDTDVADWLMGSDEDDADLAHEAVEAAACRFARQVPWRKVLTGAGFADICALDRALRTTILGLRSELADRPGAARLRTWCAQERIFLPTEGRIQPALQTALVEILARSGLDQVIAGDEFGDENRLVPLAQLRRPEAWSLRSDLPRFGTCRLIAPDHSFLVWVHWDSFFTAILAGAEAMARLAPQDQLEGFWATPSTTTYWLAQAPLPLAG